jgi:hypothetical protein
VTQFFNAYRYLQVDLPTALCEIDFTKMFAFKMEPSRQLPLSSCLSILATAPYYVQPREEVNPDDPDLDITQVPRDFAPYLRFMGDYYIEGGQPGDLLNDTNLQHEVLIRTNLGGPEDPLVCEPVYMTPLNRTQAVIAVMSMWFEIDGFDTSDPNFDPDAAAQSLFNNPAWMTSMQYGICTGIQTEVPSLRCEGCLPAGGIGHEVGIMIMSMSMIEESTRNLYEKSLN